MPPCSLRRARAQGSLPSRATKGGGGAAAEWGETGNHRDEACVGEPTLESARVSYGAAERAKIKAVKLPRVGDELFNCLRLNFPAQITRK